MTDKGSKENSQMVSGEKAEQPDMALDFSGESEGGFPCGEFLWDDEEELAPEKVT